MTRTNQSRLDAADSFFLSQQLQKLDPTTYYNVVPGVIGRRAIPRVENVSPNLPVYKYAMTVLKGSAKKTGPRGKDAPTVQVIRQPATHAIKTVESTFGYTIDEIRAAREVGEDLATELYTAAVSSIEQQIDGILATGDAASGITGLANNPNVLTSAATDKGGGDFSWFHAAVDPFKIIADVAKLVTDAGTALKQAQLPNSPEVPMFNQFSLFLPDAHLTQIATMPLNTVSGSPITVLKFIEDNFRMIKSIVPWWRLSTADAAHGNGPMAVLAPAMDNGSINPMAAGALLPMDFEQLPEQYTGRDVTVPCAGKCGGVPIRHAVAFRYMLQI